MNEEKELEISINEANSLKKITKTPGWKIIENFLDKSLEKYSKELKSEENNNIANIQADRKMLEWIKNFRDLFRYTELSAQQDEEELRRIKGNEKNTKKWYNIRKKK